MNVNFELYRVFYTVANVGNITKASEELNISQPAISKSIKTLEGQLGGQLFVRTRRGVVLTNEGRIFYYYIKQAMEFIHNAENKFTDLINLDVGSIRIGVNTTITKEFLLSYLKEFHKRYPKIDIQINSFLTSDLIEKLKNGLLDIIIANLPVEDTKDIEIIECKKVHDCFIVSDTYKDLLNKKLTLNDLNNYPLILPAKRSNTRTFLDEFTKSKNIVLKPSMELAGNSVVTVFAKIGLGIAYTSKEFIETELKSGELFVLDIQEKIPHRSIGIIISKTHLPSFSTKKLIEIITKGINE